MANKLFNEIKERILDTFDMDPIDASVLADEIYAVIPSDTAEQLEYISDRLPGLKRSRSLITDLMDEVCSASERYGEDASVETQLEIGFGDYIEELKDAGVKYYLSACEEDDPTFNDLMMVLEDDYRDLNETINALENE